MFIKAQLAMANKESFSNNNKIFEENLNKINLLD